MKTERKAKRVYLLLVLILGACCAGPVTAARCLYISSYHAGDEWNDGIERGLAAELADTCELKQFYMDSKRRPEIAAIEGKAKQAVATIHSYKPDVVITADDTALHYVLVNHFRNVDLPFVFCGASWSIEEYGEPYSNVTGMVEVSPVLPLLKQIQRIDHNVRFGLFLSSQAASEYHDFESYKSIFAAQGITLYGQLVADMAEWEDAYLMAQRYDFIILGNNSSIPDWNNQRAYNFTLTHAEKLSATVYKWMVPYTAIALTKDVEEQGEWAAKAARAIIDGMSPQSIPIIPNRRWQAWVNPDQIEKIGSKLPQAFTLKAREYLP